MAYDIDALPTYISLGNEGEEGVATVEFNVTAWVVLYPDGVYTITYMRFGSASVYDEDSGNVSLDGNTLTWTPGEALLDVPGQGSVVVHCTATGTEKRSDVCSINVKAGHAVSGTAPAPLADYTEKWGAVDVVITRLASDADPTAAVTQDETGTHFTFSIPMVDLPT